MGKIWPLWSAEGKEAAFLQLIELVRYTFTPVHQNDKMVEFRKPRLKPIEAQHH